MQELHYGALMRLCLSDNALGAQGAADLAALISDCVPGLESLRLALSATCTKISATCTKI